PQSYLQVVEKLGYAGSFAAFYETHYFTFGKAFCPEACLTLQTWNHLWFVAYLWAYTMIVAGLFAAAPDFVRAAERIVARAGGHLDRPGARGVPPSPVLAACLKVAYATNQWCAIAAILGFGRRWIKGDSPARRYLVDAVFPYYIVRQTAIIVTA